VWRIVGDGARIADVFFESALLIKRDGFIERFGDGLKEEIIFVAAMEEVFGALLFGDEVLDLVADVDVHPDGIGAEVGPGFDAGVGGFVGVVVDFLVRVAGVGDLPVVELGGDGDEVGWLEVEGRGQALPVGHVADGWELALEPRDPLIDDGAHAALRSDSRTAMRRSSLATASQASSQASSAPMRLAAAESTAGPPQMILT